MESWNQSAGREISRLLIANRGEIAVRIARTADRLGIETVGVYSEPDARAMHVDAVDQAVALGGSTPADSYLRGDDLIDIAIVTGCDAVHPGYGFLAENAGFAEATAAAGLIWVGPTPSQIRLLGDKVAAKKAAIEAGVPTAALIEIADGVLPGDVPLPALVKAAAGGGGRGMRIVRDAADLADAVEAGSREALAAFGDGTVFVEPYIEHARHVEVQIMGDQHGNVVHLGERECSIQRRNQKIVEESPSAGISEETRIALCDGAVALAASVGYHGAGTVEFLVGDGGVVNFLEVNTRLQVEHPVTEAVTGLDLVELQLVVAEGRQLPISQDDVVVSGHAIEVRLVAEDPAGGWIPSTGEVTHFDIGDGVRLDTGFRAGSIVSPEYDSLLAKVIAHGTSRSQAARILRRSLAASTVSGPATNLASLVSILAEPDYLAAATPTSYLDTHPDVLAAGPDDDVLEALLVGATFARERRERTTHPVTGFAPSGWRNLRTRGQREVWSTAGVEHHVEVVIDHNGRDDEADAHAQFLIGPWPVPAADGTLPHDDRRLRAVRIFHLDDGRTAVELDGRRLVVDVRFDDETAVVSSAAGGRTFTLQPRFVASDVEAAGSGPICPLPGTVIAVHVEPGQTVDDGDLLMVVEAMKMEHKIVATVPAIVAQVHFGVGDRVDSGDLLVTLEQGDADQVVAP